MIPAGSCPTVGIAGLTLGGGHGFSGRKYGLTCDNLRSLTIVTASGQALLASQTQHPDLFWACRGGGAGQFGIVTSFVFNTHPASDVATYRATWNWSDAAKIVAAWQAWAPTAPDELFSMCDLIATDGAGGPIVASNGQYFGGTAALQTLLQPLVNAAPPKTMEIRLRSFVNAALDWANCSEVARCHIGVPNAEVGRSDFLAKSDYVATPLSSGGIQAMIQKIEQRQNDPALGGGSILMDAYGGAINRVAKDSTAFVHRDQLFSIQYVAGSSSAADADWLRAFRGAMAPFVSGQAYQNYIDPELQQPNVAYYGVEPAASAEGQGSLRPEERVSVRSERASRSSVLTRDHSRSAFASRNPSASNGSAGRPPMSRQTASASVAPKERVSNSQVNRGRRFHRADAARNRAKNSRSGRPRFAAPFSPGIGKAKEKFVKTLRCSVTITFVGPRHTE